MLSASCSNLSFGVPILSLGWTRGFVLEASADLRDSDDFCALFLFTPQLVASELYPALVVCTLAVITYLLSNMCDIFFPALNY